MSRIRIPRRDLPYNDSDSESIIGYASKLTGKSLGDIFNTQSGLKSNKSTKGYFGQKLETGFFFLDNDNSPKPDFEEAGIELKSAPMKKSGKSLVSKERLVLGIINYKEVPERGFGIFTDKDSHMLIVFYLWDSISDIYDYKILKVVDWTPTEEELRMIREDWDVIEGYIKRGEAHLLSEKHTKYLAACTKGTGHNADMRIQPMSEIMAKQRALSFKASFMTSLYYTHPDINEACLDITSNDESIIHPNWKNNVTFEDYVKSLYMPFVGLTCKDIEEKLGITLESKSKQYYYTLSLAMAGVMHKKHIREFEQAGIKLKTIRIRKDGRPKESMSFPAFSYDEIAEHTWMESDFYEQLDHKFFFPVFEFTIKECSKQNRKSLVFKGAFFWIVPDKDLETIASVWNDTKKKILSGKFDSFIKCSERRISHVRPHGRNTNDTITFRGKKLIKRCFWLNDNYLEGVIKKNLGK